MDKEILLVDDEPGILKVLSISLADRGYKVLTADTGEEALRVFREKKPGIILTDIKMAGLDGIALLQKVKGENPDTEVIMITGHGDMQLAIQSLKYEASDFLTKPIDDEALQVALRRARERIFFRNSLREYTENLERLVEEKTRKLVDAERLAAVGETVAGLAHAIKNITGGLSGGVFVLEKGIELENKTYLSQGWQMVKGNVDKVKNLALDLLNYAKEGKAEYRLCDPQEPAREVLELMQAKAKENGILLRGVTAQDVPKAWIDPEGVHRVLLNLITNAVDACTDLRCTNRPSEVTLKSSRPPGWAVEYQVIDNGCGMDGETQAKAFQSFFTTKGSKGTGLGLMLVKKIIDKQGGTVRLETAEGKGTTITVRLPLRKNPP